MAKCGAEIYGPKPRERGEAWTRLKWQKRQQTETKSEKETEATEEGSFLVQSGSNL